MPYNIPTQYPGFGDTAVSGNRTSMEDWMAQRQARGIGARPQTGGGGNQSQGQDPFNLLQMLMNQRPQTQEFDRTSQQQQTSQSQDQVLSQLVNTQNMTDQSLGALESLVAQLSRGGTVGQRTSQMQTAQHNTMIQNLLQQFSKGAAFRDAEALSQREHRALMERMAPQIARQSEAAGASAGSMRGLLLNDAAQRTQESAAALGAQQAGQYGNLQAQFASLLRDPTQISDPVTSQLIQALGLARGAVELKTPGEMVLQQLRDTTQQGTSGTQESGTTTTARTPGTEEDLIRQLLEQLGAGTGLTGAGRNRSGVQNTMEARLNAGV